MYETEQKLLNHKDYSKFCKAVSSTDSSCDPNGYFSLTSEFTFPGFSQADFDTFRDNIRTDNDKWLKYKFLFGAEFDHTNSSSNSKYLRSIFYLSNPITWDGTVYKTSFDKEKE